MAITSTPGTIPPASSPATAPINPFAAFTKEYNMLKGEHYHFYCKPDGGGVAPILYQHVLGLAEHKVWVWDAYFHQPDGAIFGAFTHSGVEVKIITEPKVPIEAFKSGCVAAMETAMSAAVKVGCSVTIAQAKAAFADWKNHDRFLIVDESRVYLIGSSVSYYLSVGESTGAYEVTSVADKDLIIKAFNYYWMALDKVGNVASHSF
jgi:hypothetical protein